MSDNKIVPLTPYQKEMQEAAQQARLYTILTAGDDYKKFEPTELVNSIIKHYGIKASYIKEALVGVVNNTISISEANKTIIGHLDSVGCGQDAYILNGTENIKVHEWLLIIDTSIAKCLK